MIIEKFLHSCLRVTKGGRRILIDPGLFCFIDGEYAPADLGTVDAVFVTHEHADHYDPVALRTFVDAGAALYTNASLAAKMRKAGLAATAIAAGKTHTIAGFGIRVVGAAHEPLPAPVPDNVALLVDGKLLHCGDSLHPDIAPGIEVIAAAYMTPFANIVQVVEAMRRLTPRTLLPVHDGYLKEYARARQEDNLRGFLDPHDIAVRRLERGDHLELA